MTVPAQIEAETQKIDRLAPFLRNLRNRDQVSDEECQLLVTSIARFRHVDGSDDIIREGQVPHESCLLVEGYAVRTHHMDDGRMQISAIHVPGDFVDLHGFLLGTMDHNVTALGPCLIGYVPHAQLKEITERHPHLTRMLWLLTLVDAAIHRRWLATAGRLPSIGQIAHLICELRARLLAVGLTDGSRFRLPLTQDQLADAMGLSSVHVNRTLQELRRRNLIVWQGFDVEILEWQALCHLASFDPSYLNLSVRPR